MRPRRADEVAEGVVAGDADAAITDVVLTVMPDITDVVIAVITDTAVAPPCG